MALSSDPETIHYNIKIKNINFTKKLISFKIKKAKNHLSIICKARVEAILIILMPTVFSHTFTFEDIP